MLRPEDLDRAIISFDAWISHFRWPKYAPGTRDDRDDLLDEIAAHCRQRVEAGE